MTDQELNKALEDIRKRLDPVNRLYIERIARQIRKIGELNQSSINRLVVMAEMTSNVNEIVQALMQALSAAKPEIATLFNRAMQDTYTDPRFTRAFSSGLTVPPMKRQELVNFTRGVALQTNLALDNLSNTTAIQQPYRAAVDEAVLAVGSGLTSYTAATRDAIRQIGYNGMQVYYASGYHRRLDTAVRQNILDATRQITQHCADEVGKSLGYDAVELSAHMYSAPDHEPVQGRVFLRAEFDKMQAGSGFRDVDGHSYGGFKRPIGEWNCRHFAMPFSTEFSKRQYTDAQLQQWADANKNGCEIDGKHATIYQASQKMRGIETEIRRWKDTAVMAQVAGDDTLRRECQSNINALSTKYNQIAGLSGLTQHRNRMTVEGFKAVKMNPSKPPNTGTVSGGVTGAKKTPGWEDRHAERYYEEVRNRAPYADADKISQSTEFSRDEIEQIRQHVFIDKHDLGGEIRRFDPDYYQAEAWQRLTEGNGTPEDVVFLRHELKELTLMRDLGYNQSEAHAQANLQYNWWELVWKRLNGGE